MCGIAGIYNFDKSLYVDSNLLKRMTDAIAHRGPDDEGHYINGNIGLGHRRLAVIDPSPSGHQPMCNEDKSIWITFNGEIYNYTDLLLHLKSKGHQFKSHTDTETIIHLYEEYGIDFIHRLKGMFSFAIWDSNSELLLLVRDRVGIKPLYYYEDNNHFVFASEMKSILEDPLVEREINYHCLGDYLRYKSIPGNDSILKNIHKLTPGHYLLVKKDKITEKEYWDLNTSIDNSIELSKACSDFDVIFSDTINSHLVSDVPVGAFLSGGIDSSAVVSYASGRVQNPMKTYSCAFAGHANFDESPYARIVSGLCNTQHVDFNLTPDLVSDIKKIAWHFDEPFAISSAFGLYMLSREASKDIKVILTGDGADEIFGGYDWHNSDYEPYDRFIPAHLKSCLRKTLIENNNILCADNHEKDFNSRCKRKLRNILLEPARRYSDLLCSGFNDSELKLLLLPDVYNSIVSDNRQSYFIDTFNKYPGNDEIARRLYTDFKTTLVSEMLTKVDRMTMAFGLEARVPFLDHSLVEWSFGIPSHLKRKNDEGKYFLRKALESRLPHEILRRRKHGFNLPMNQWFKEDIKDYICSCLSGDNIIKRNLFNPGHVTKILTEHFNGICDHSSKIMVLLMLELWFENFTDAG